MKHIKVPQLYTNPIDHHSVFLAGSIEMGRATEWQERLVAEFENYQITFYNPRRDDWDPTWSQTFEHPEFNQQVTWELTMIDQVDTCIFYFDGDTFSPVTMMELGYVGGTRKRAVVYCPEKYFRHGNVEIFCNRYKILLCVEYDDFIESLKYHFSLWQK